MLTDMRTSQLVAIRDKLDDCLTIVKSSLNVRSQLIDLKGSNAVLSAQIDSKNDPEPFYKFRLFDKGISIIYWNINDGFGLCYHIKCYNCTIPGFSSGEYKLPFDIVNRCYGHWPDLDVAVVWFRRAVASFLADVDHYTIQWPLDIF